MIPKKLHYVWIGPYEDPESYIDSWADKMPEFEIVKWNNPTEYLEEAVSLFGGVNSLKDKSFTYVSDLIRLLILRDHGGIYLDHDILVVKDLQPLLDHDIILTFQYESLGPELTKGKSLKELLDTEYGKFQSTSATVNNCFIASVQNHSFIHSAIEETLSNHFKDKSEQYAMSDWGVGPEVFTSVAKKYKFDVSRCDTQTISGVKILHRKYVHPTHSLVRYLGQDQYRREIEQALSASDTFAVHIHVNSGAKLFSQGESMLFSDWYLKR